MTDKLLAGRELSGAGTGLGTSTSQRSFPFSPLGFPHEGPLFSAAGHSYILSDHNRICFRVGLTVG